MPSFETPEPISATLEISMGDVRVVATDRADTVVEVRPTDLTDASDVKAAERTQVEFTNGTLLVKGPRYRGMLFGKGGSSSAQILKSTNPNTIKVKLDVTNTTGIAMNSGNGNTASAVLTVPGMPTNCGLGLFNCATGPTPGGQSDPAFTLKQAKAHPDDRTDDIPVNFQVLDSAHYAANGNRCTYDSSNAAMWSDPAPKLPNGVAAKCIRASGFAIPNRHFTRLDYSFELRAKGTDNWPTTPDAKLFFRAGFSFRETTVVTFTNPATTRSADLAFGVVGAGQKVTAVGGYAYDLNMNGISGLKARLFNASPGAPPASVGAGSQPWCSSSFAASGAVAEDTTQTDGFFFVWKRGADQSSAAAAALPANVQYVIVLCGSTYENARSTLTNKLSNQEFDEVEFRLKNPTFYGLRGTLRHGPALRFRH
jgi:hypothetical protein